MFQANNSEPDPIAYFKEITQVPRPSGHEEKMREYLTAFAVKNDLAYQRDAAGNILITKKGSSHATKVILQAHMDMVPAAVDGKAFDFVTQPLTITEKDGIITADGTTLGADNGAGICIILSILESAAKKYPEMELSGLFTAEEETTGKGALEISPVFLNAEYLINIDSDTEGQIIIGSAGAAETTATFASDLIPADANLTWYQLNVSGLHGGHSGLDIGKKRANAILLAAGFLTRFEKVVAASFAGGNAMNSIPASATAVFGLPADFNPSPILAAYQKEVATTYADSDSKISITLEQTEMPSVSWSASHTEKIITALEKIPTGVLRHAEDGTVLTSSNIGMVSENAGKLRVSVFTRSNIPGDMEPWTAEIREAFNKAGATVTTTAAMPPWLEDETEPLIACAKDAYLQIAGKQASVTTTHGGLETGHFAMKNPNLQLLSCGPDISNCHNPKESVRISSILTVEKWVRRILTTLSTK